MADVWKIVGTAFAAGGAVVGFVIWFVQLLITRRFGEISADRTRRLEKSLSYYERQVEEFYGPIWNLIHQIYACNETKEHLLADIDPSRKPLLEEYYQNRYFRPLHDELRNILKTKLYLANIANMIVSEEPEEKAKIKERTLQYKLSFYEYLLHSLQERDQFDLWRTYSLSTTVQGIDWPARFERDIRDGFAEAIENRDRCLNGLKLDKVGQKW